MEVFIQLRDHENRLHSSYQTRFQLNDNLERLRQSIREEWNIYPEKQQLYFEDEKPIVGVGEDLLQTIGVTHRCNILVRHTYLRYWIAFLKCMSLAQKAKESNLSVSSDVEDASDQLKKLVENKFFVTYPTFLEQRQVFNQQFSYYLDSEYKYIELATEHYFALMYKDNPSCPKFKIKCVPKRKSGVQGGLECQVYEHSQLIQLYHVKIHTRLAKWHDDKSCDLRELFIYKLMELVNIGPKVYFYPNVHFSGFGLYIATEDIPHFRTESCIYDEDNSTRMIQLDLLSTCFYLTDLESNDENFGADKDGKLKVVDFEIKRHDENADSLIKKFFRHSSQCRVDIAKAAFSSWDLSRNIDLANIQIEDQKQLLKNHNITFKSDRHLDQYLMNIKRNVEVFERYLK